MNKNLIIDLTPETLSKNQNEFKRFLAVIQSMESYGPDTLKEASKMEKDFEIINSKYPYPKYPFNYKERITRLKQAIELNQSFLNELIKIYKPPPSYYVGIDFDEIKHSRFDEQKFIINILIYTMRDWAKEREEERKNNYNDIINEVIKHLPPEKNRKDSNERYKILIPGCGLNRLGYELVKYGYDVETNDYLFLNGIFSDFIFNRSKKEMQSIQPFIYSFSNFLNEDDVFKKFSFPNIDIDLKNNDKYGKLKMTVGDFLTIYNNIKDYFDCVITCYFIDTAQNVIHYIDQIYNILKKGGIWINFGPLSYHWSVFPDSVSIELPYDKIKEVIINYGFEYIKEDFKMSSFGHMDNHMHNEIFKCIYFAVKK
jgi:carnosine N-methyltransferase